MIGKNGHGRGNKAVIFDKAGEAAHLHSLQHQIEKALLHGQIGKAKVNASCYLTRRCLYN